jgi:hypothetical protein
MSNIKLAFFSTLSPEAKGALIGSLVVGGASALGRYTDEAADYELPEGVDFYSLTDKQKARLKKKGGKFFDVLGAGLGGAAMGGGLGYLAGRVFGGATAMAGSNRGGNPESLPTPPTSKEKDPDIRANMPLSNREAAKLGVPSGTRAGEVVAMGSSNLPDFRGQEGTVTKPEKITTIRSHLEPVYENAPGGLEKAVDEAQRWQSEAERAGLVSWDRGAIDRPVRWTDDPNKWSRAVGKQFSFGQTRGFNVPLVNWSYIDPKLKGNEKAKVLQHELTHSVLRKPGMAGLDQAVKSKDSVSPNNYSPSSLKGQLWKYVSRPEEWKAHFAEIKRDWVKNNKDQLDTPAKALDAMREYLKDPENRNSAVTPLIEDILKDPDAKEKAILQLLSIVRSGGKSKSTNA